LPSKVVVLGAFAVGIDGIVAGLYPCGIFIEGICV
jgi:hypothetical protein